MPIVKKEYLKNFNKQSFVLIHSNSKNYHPLKQNFPKRTTTRTRATVATTAPITRHTTTIDTAASVQPATTTTTVTITKHHSHQTTKSYSKN